MTIPNVSASNLINDLISLNAIYYSRTFKAQVYTHNIHRVHIFLKQMTI